MKERKVKFVNNAKEHIICPGLSPPQRLLLVNGKRKLGAQ